MSTFSLSLSLSLSLSSSSAVDELKAKINGFLDNKPEDLVAQIQTIYETYLCPSSPSYIPLDPHQVSAIADSKHMTDRQVVMLALLNAPAYIVKTMPFDHLFSMLEIVILSIV